MSADEQLRWHSNEFLGNLLIDDMSCGTTTRTDHFLIGKMVFDDLFRQAFEAGSSSALLFPFVLRHSDEIRLRSKRFCSCFNFVEHGIKQLHLVCDPFRFLTRGAETFMLKQLYLLLEILHFAEYGS